MYHCQDTIQYKCLFARIPHLGSEQMRRNTSSSKHVMNNEIPFFIMFNTILNKGPAILIYCTDFGQPKILLCKLVNNGIDFNNSNIQTKLHKRFRGNANTQPTTLSFKQKEGTLSTLYLVVFEVVEPVEQPPVKQKQNKQSPLHQYCDLPILFQWFPETIILRVLDHSIDRRGASDRIWELCTLFLNFRLHWGYQLYFPFCRGRCILAGAEILLKGGFPFECPDTSQLWRVSKSCTAVVWPLT